MTHYKKINLSFAGDANEVFVLALFFINLFNWTVLIESYYSIPHIVKYIFSFCTFLGLAFYLVNAPLMLAYPRKTKPIFFLFFLYSIFLLTNSVYFRAYYLQEFFANRYAYMPYLIPLIALTSRFDISFWANWVRFSTLILPFAVLTQFFVLSSQLPIDNWNEPFHRIRIFDIGIPLLLLTAHLIKKPKGLLILLLVYFFFFFFLSAYHGRRGLLLEYVLFFFFFLFINIKNNSVPKREFLNWLFLIGLVSIGIFVFWGYDWIANLYVFHRGFGPEAWLPRKILIQDFFSDFGGISDWSFGRGLNGTIYRSFSETKLGRGIENGFLILLLKGGSLLLLCMMTIFLNSIYLGFFKSNNDLVKAMAVVVLVHVIGMIIFNVPDYSSKYILLWACVASCHDKNLRKISNQDLIRFINAERENKI